MPRFHEDSRNPKVSPDVAMQHKMNTTRTNAYENERKRTSRGCPYPPTISMDSNPAGIRDRISRNSTRIPHKRPVRCAK
jgi:hypothetical protein